MCDLWLYKQTAMGCGMSSENDPKHIDAQGHKLYKTIAIIIILEGIEKIKTEQMTPKQSEQSSEHLQVEWLYFPWMKIHN